MGKLIFSSIELSKLKSAVTTTAKGTKCLMIPIDQQGIIQTESGKVYLNFNIWENDQVDQYGNSHGFVHQQTKEQIAAKEKSVYIGNGKTYVKDAPKVETTHDESKSIADDDLPF